ncbi:MAG: universal stress protein [Nitrospirae bacterium]|nr:universal stress protein [Nitrospirota bacterium]
MAPFIGRILLATDFSECAARAQGYAVFLATACQAKLDILHVLEFQPGMDPDFPVNSLYLEQLRKETDRQLDDLVNRAKQAGLAAQGQHVLGIPSQRINEKAKDSDADLVVLGTHGRTGLEHILLGSTAERVVKGAPCPVLTVRLAKPPGRAAEAGQAAVPAGIRHVLAPVDFSDCSLDALEYAVQVAKQFGSAVTILHVLEPVSYGLDFALVHAAEEHKMRKRLETRLADLATLLTSHGLQAKHVMRGGLPADSILEFVRGQGCDLIVMGTHGRRGVSHLISGSVAEAVLRRAECLVLTVKSPKFSPGHKRVVLDAARRPV